MQGEKSEFHYLSTILVCGTASSMRVVNKIFNLDIFKKHRDLSITVKKVRKGEERLIKLNDGVYIRAYVEYIAHTGNFAPIITYVNEDSRVYLSDTLFNVSEFNIYGLDVKSLISRKIGATADLIRAFAIKDISIFPLLINDFPNISKLILEKADFILN